MLGFLASLTVLGDIISKISVISYVLIIPKFKSLVPISSSLYPDMKGSFPPNSLWDIYLSQP